MGLPLSVLHLSSSDTPSPSGLAGREYFFSPLQSASVASRGCRVPKFTPELNGFLIPVTPFSSAPQFWSCGICWA